MFIELPLHVVSAELDADTGEYIELTPENEGNGPTGIIELGIIGVRHIAYCIPGPDRDTCNIMLDNGAVVTVMESYENVRTLIARAIATGKLSAISVN